ncbi:Isoquinoline 1-oxidoreductase subunit [Caulobacter hibisci]|uniref:Isoquinoline 1-oxidoreductase subunit n=1 Tax=Caulobacter hibisci TaxID=2035993 RepID=A0ABS0SYG0_9CAUL|nr:Isoquinoline 1-oxidoreductase subunit [Caulobacter hibisci]MBI1684670.1 Isoquinoline 1-oxidoreductase subunit [Caulobacter hibisci]
MSRPAALLLLTGLALAGGAVVASALDGQPAAAASAPVPVLKTAADFQSIQDPAARSLALFAEAGKVIQSPRCLNCHPATRVPTQDDDLHPHDPPMVAGQSGHGPTGLPCRSCHGPANVRIFGEHIKSMPGDPKWAVAPAEMAWQGKSLGAICAQLKDPARNGGKTLAQLQHHMAHDHLVGWSWNPGEGRKPAPGTQAQLGALIQAWMDTGAKCPKA